MPPGRFYEKGERMNNRIKAQKRNWRIFQLRGMYAYFKQHNDREMMALIDKRLAQLGAKKASEVEKRRLEDE